MGLMLLAVLQALFGKKPRRPSWTFQFRVIQRFMRLDWEKTADWDFTRLRDDMKTRPYPRKFTKLARQRDESLGGVPACVWEPPKKRDTDRRVVFYFHGGSFIYGSPRTSHAEMLARLAVETGVEVVGLEYRLAPEHPFPAQIDDALAAWDALVAKGVSPDQIILGGDSAGGNLAVETAIALRDRGKPLPKALLLLSPWSDLEMRGASFVENEPYDFGRREELVRHAAAYANGVALDDPRLSPIHAKLEGLPDAFVSRGACEIPRDDIAALTNALRDAGVRVTEYVAADMPHNAAFFADYHPNALASFEATARFVREKLP